MATNLDNAATARGGDPGLRLPGLLLGLGLGGFVDGILLHQVLQWHHMLSSTDTDRVGIPYYPTDTVAGLQVNTLWDGIFHVASWLSVVAGVAVLYARARRSAIRAWSARSLSGLVLAGWGVFNVVEGLVNHEILGIHHVRDGPDRVLWDVAFLALGVLLIGAGWLLYRSGPTVARGSRDRAQ